MAPHDIRRPFKRAAISDQQKRRDLSLLRQTQNRRDAQHQARRLASTVLSLPSQNSEPALEDLELVPEPEITEAESPSTDIDIRLASKLRGPQVRLWFAKQLMLPEWMIDVPDRLNYDWYVFARPSGKRCFVVSSNGTTISRLRNGSLLHRFPSALPNGSRNKDAARSGQSYCILDCIFHELDQTYYVIDMVCWAGVSFYECTAEFRFFWLNNKLLETGACEAPSLYHNCEFRFSLLSVYNCDQEGLHTAYTGAVPYVKDGLSFYNKLVLRMSSNEDNTEEMNGKSFGRVKQRFKDRTQKVAQTKEILSKQAVQTKEILSKQAEERFINKVTHFLGVLGFGTFCFLLGARFLLLCQHNLLGHASVLSQE